MPPDPAAGEPSQAGKDDQRFRLAVGHRVGEQAEGPARAHPQRSQLIAAALGQPAAIGAFARRPGRQIGEEDGRLERLGAAAFAVGGAAGAANRLFDHNGPSPHVPPRVAERHSGHQQVAGGDALRLLAAGYNTLEAVDGHEPAQQQRPANMPARTSSRLTPCSKAPPKTSRKTTR